MPNWFCQRKTDTDHQPPQSAGVKGSRSAGAEARRNDEAAQAVARTTLDARSTRRRQREPPTPHHQRLTRCAPLPLRCYGWRAARAGMRHECKPVPPWGKRWCGAAKVVGGWRKGLAAAGVVERSAGRRMVRNEPPAAAMPFRRPCGWLPPARAGLVLRPGATPARYGT